MVTMCFLESREEDRHINGQAVNFSRRGKSWRVWWGLRDLEQATHYNVWVRNFWLTDACIEHSETSGRVGSVDPSNDGGTHDFNFVTFSVAARREFVEEVLLYFGPAEEYM